ncbi:MAG TPA: 23S rRNA (adenine(2503)-C(2))-methyltransferase RlmN [Treponemataceae bacterium]|nr:23S rRNA (adenine(2503)-C(2))-methyltransferase RlmN [Treponemataceae bacterium]
MNKICLSGLLPEEIAKLLQLRQPFRGQQIFKWISDNVTSFDKMTNISISLRTTLKNTSCIRSSIVTDTLIDPDGTIKLQIKLHDEYLIETVLLIDSKNRKTACVSCQAGCAMKCSFCKTGTLGLARNLTAGEIVEQFRYLEEKAGILDNIVFMGMGEPMMNLEAIRKSIQILSHPDGRNISTRRITISTCGIIKGIYDLADNGPAVRLAISLTTADPALRSILMPITKNNPLPELKKAIYYFIEKTGKRCTLEATLLGDTNTDNENIQRMIEFAKDLSVHVNIIPWNPVLQLPYREPTRHECAHYIQVLERAGITVTQRARRGRKIGGACGQLGKIKV